MYIFFTFAYFPGGGERNSLCCYHNFFFLGGGAALAQQFHDLLNVSAVVKLLESNLCFYADLTFII